MMQEGLGIKLQYLYLLFFFLRKKITKCIIHENQPSGQSWTVLIGDY